MIRIYTSLSYIILIILIATLQATLLSAQPELSKIKFEDYIYVNYIKSIQFNDGTSQFSDPITSLNGRLYLSFDDLDSDRYDYNYMIVHCDKDWNPSEIDPQEYVVGFNYDEIQEQGTFSKFTKVDYVHYNLSLPTRQVRWTISGNYVLVIYDQEDNPVLSRRFVIYETLGKLRTERLKSTHPGGHNTHHRIGLKYWDLPTSFTDKMYLAGITVKVMQNKNWSTLSEGIAPTLYQNKEFLFNQSKYPSFESYRDFRQCGIRSLEFNSSNLIEIREVQDSIFALLPLSKPFQRETYSYVFDRNGRFIINSRDGNTLNTPEQNAITELDYNETDRIYSEYAWVVFSIESVQLPEAPVYVIGGFSDYKLYPEYQLHYDEKRNAYIGTALMKQGRYDYHIVQIIDGKISYQHTEKYDHEATQDYRTFVYYREFGGIYDRVLNVDFLKVNSDL